MSNAFQETYFNTKTKSKYKKHSIEVDTNNDFYMKLVMSLFKFKEKWVETEGGFPEEVDRRCVDMLGLRFDILVGTMLDLHFRKKLFDQGQIDNIFIHLYKMDFDNGESYEISEEEHEFGMSCLETLLDNSENLIPFFDSLSDFAI